VTKKSWKWLSQWLNKNNFNLTNSLSMTHIILKNFKFLFFWGIIFALLSLVTSLFLPVHYSAESQILIISRDRSGVDPYTQAKSAERVGENLAQVMKTTDFYNKVMDSKYSFDKASWKKLTERNQRKQWDKNVRASVLYGTGLMDIKAYSHNKQDALNLSNATAQTLATRGWEYIGGDVAIKVVSPPLVSSWPARPNFVINIIVGFVVGLFLSGMWIVKYKKRGWLR